MGHNWPWTLVLLSPPDTLLPLVPKVCYLALGDLAHKNTICHPPTIYRGGGSPRFRALCGCNNKEEIDPDPDLTDKYSLCPLPPTQPHPGFEFYGLVINHLNNDKCYHRILSSPGPHCEGFPSIPSPSWCCCCSSISSLGGSFCRSGREKFSFYWPFDFRLINFLLSSSQRSI